MARGFLILLLLFGGLWVTNRDRPTSQGPPLPRISLFSLPPPPIGWPPGGAGSTPPCLRRTPEAGAGVGDTDRWVVYAAVLIFSCGVDSNDADLALQRSAGAAQRARFARLVGHGPYDKTVVTAVGRDATGRVTTVTVRFHPGPGTGEPVRCWRSELTLDQSGNGVAAITDPAAVACGARSAPATP